MLRNMSNAFRSFEFYSSTFDTDTGVLVRQVEVPRPVRKYGHITPGTLFTESLPPVPVFYNGSHYDWEDQHRAAWAEAFGQSATWLHDTRSTKAFSPVPETIDVKITNWCNGPGGELCSYCYMDSTTRGKHAPRSLLESIFSGLPTAPYQIAFGGGEPTAHPDFPWFLEFTRSKDTVPNYTTAGHIMRHDVIEATNKYVGGVALTYHAFKGPAYFKETYDKWRSALDRRVALNVHVLFDNDVADNLLDLQAIGLQGLNVVLLAYYPEVGRSRWAGIPSKGVYGSTFPAALSKVTKESKFRIAFSEGLLPYFLSHQLPEVDTRFAQQQEGLFSCYIDDAGRVSQSSFSPPSEDDPTIYDVPLVDTWRTASGWKYTEVFSQCRECKFASQCHVTHRSHFMLCKFASHNSTPPAVVPARRHLKVL